MRHIKFCEPTSDRWKEEWKEWREKCEVEQKILNESHMTPDPKDITTLYSDLKEYYMDLESPFYGKCVYCESSLESQFGDLDHFRPKGRIQENGETVKIIDETGKEIQHPGYYWLAYDHENLLPACEVCNRTNAWKTGNKIGKLAEFPVRSFRASKPGEEKHEEPLLLNPVSCDNLNKHFIFEKCGVVTSDTDEGKKCIEIFGLNDRTGLANKRAEAYEEGFQIALVLHSAFTRENSKDEITFSKKREDIEKGRFLFSAAALEGYKAGKAAIVEALDRL